MEAKETRLWNNEEYTKTLCGEPVLTLCFEGPMAAGRLHPGIVRYYGRMYRMWKQRWEGELYLRACADLAVRRERAKPFYPWKASLSGAVKWDRDGLLSVALLAQETGGDRRTLEYRWGDTWRRRDGAPVPLCELLGEKNMSWLRQQLEQTVHESCRQGLGLDDELRRPLRRWFSPERVVLSDSGLEVYYPQCTLGPAVEGAPIFCLSLLNDLYTEDEQEGNKVRKSAKTSEKYNENWVVKNFLKKSKIGG